MKKARCSLKRVMTFVLLLSIILILVVNISSVFALTATIGNAKMILYADVGDQIQKYILVKNDNDVPVDITLFASGDLAQDIDITDDEFTLQPGYSKKAYFIIHVNEVGTFESNINVQFTPAKGNGAGLSSSVIVIAGEGSDDVDDNDLDNDGYSSVESGGNDCDDDDSSIYPGASEVLNDGIDQNCDGSDLVDDGSDDESTNDGDTTNNNGGSNTNVNINVNTNDDTNSGSDNNAVDDGSDVVDDGSDVVDDVNTDPAGITGSTIESFEKPNLTVVLSVLAVALIVAIVVILMNYNNKLKNKGDEEEVETKSKKSVKKK